MNQLDSPFTKLDELLDEAAEPLPPIRILDFHCEITSEKNAMGWYLDGRVTAVVGTHTHVPTADARVLPGGTAYISDIGMTGPAGLGHRLQSRDGAAAVHPSSADALRGGRGTGVVQRGRDHRGPRHRARERHRAGPAPHRGLTAVREAPLLAVVGPTASGKTDLALALATALAGRDHRRRLAAGLPGHGHRHGQAGCRGPRRGAAPPARPRRSRTSRSRWPSGWSALVPSWRRSPRAAASRWSSAAAGLYVSALLDGHDYASQPWSPEVRAALTDGARSRGSRAARRPPDAAAIRRRRPAIDLRNPRRVLRALERAEARAGGASPTATPYPGRIGLAGRWRSRPARSSTVGSTSGRAGLFARRDSSTRCAALLAAGYGAELRPMTGHGYGEAIRHLAGEWITRAGESR